MMTASERLKRLQHLDSKYAALARSRYSFGAGTATSAPSTEQLAEIESQMKAVTAEMDSLKKLS